MKIEVQERENSNSTPSFQSPGLNSTIPGRAKSLPVTRVMTPIASSRKAAIATEFNSQEDWLPLTESRNGNAYYAAFHTLSSGIGFQALLLPFAFSSLGWVWGITCMTVIFIWQLYTSWLLIQLHHSPIGTRYSRYLQLCMAAFGQRAGKLLALLPIMYLSGGTCVALIMLSGSTLKFFFEIVSNSSPLTTLEWYLVFTCCAVTLAQFPNLNSIASVSFIGAVTGVSYCTLIWVMSVAKGHPAGVSYEPHAHTGRVCDAIGGLGIIALALRGHNLVLEIQGTMPSMKEASSGPMWRVVKFSYLIIAMCLFPLAMAGYWAYGNTIPPGNEGILKAMYNYHGHNTSKALLALPILLIAINALTSFQIYAMPVFDNLESRYTSRTNKPCPKWLRSGIRAFFGCLTFFISVAIPFLPSLAGLLGGISLPVTLAYPCLMWVRIKNPKRYSTMWYLNWGIGSLGVLLSILVVTGATWKIVILGMEVHFFRQN